jgi:hypothetical protein
MGPLLQGRRAQRLVGRNLRHHMIAGIHDDLTGQGLPGRLQPRAPHLETIPAARDFRLRPGAIGARHAVVRPVGHQDVGQHGVVDVAAQRHQAGAVEVFRRMRGAAIQPEFEGMRGGEGVDLVTDLVGIGEAHGRAHRNDQQVG